MKLFSILKSISVYDLLFMIVAVGVNTLFYLLMLWLDETDRRTDELCRDWLTTTTFVIGAFIIYWIDMR